MGWAGGSELFASVLKATKKYVPAEDREKVLRELYDAFKDEDWDTEDEVRDPDWRRVWKKICKENGWE